MKSVLISIKPKWCELIANGKKAIEVRKTKPKLDTPFKCYIYYTKNKWQHRVKMPDKSYRIYNGKDYKEALQIAKEELSRAIYLSECSRSAGIGAINEDKAEWLSILICNAEEYMRKGDEGK